MRKLKKGFSPKQGRLKDSNGQLVDSDARAETFAEHLEKIQWAVRPTTVMQNTEAINEPLPVEVGAVTDDEVGKAAAKLKLNRACGLDGIPAEVWKAALQPGSSARSWIVSFCQTCWEQRRVPQAWRESRVAMIFKKSDPALPENYRPICLVQIGYKLFAMVMLQRLKRAGAENKLWPTQFGFRSGHGTIDAIFAARRVVEQAWLTQQGQCSLLALDWAKAFDSVTPDALFKSLSRFGIPPTFVEVVVGIYSDRTFVVRDQSRPRGDTASRAGYAKDARYPRSFLSLS